MTEKLYADPQAVDNVEDCYFYHQMELPGHGAVDGDWNIQSVVDDYLGNIDFKGKRVLDVGTASGYLTFEMEKRGADVVSFDMASGDNWNIVPHVEVQRDQESIRAQCRAVHQQLVNSYWLSHQALGSNAKVHYGDIYNMPVELGGFDVVFMGMILPHLRDPFQAMYSASRLCREKMVINFVKPSGLTQFFSRSTKSKFLPSTENGIRDIWWKISPACIEAMLGVLGFEIREQVRSDATCSVQGNRKVKKCVTVIAHRVAGQCAGLESESRGRVVVRSDHALNSSSAA